MAIQVTDEILTIVATDPVIVEAGKEALRAVNARAAAAAQSAGKASPGEETAGEEAPGEEAGDKSATTTVIRGDNPHAAGLAKVWLELRKTLNTLADPSAQTRRVAVAVRPPDNPESRPRRTGPRSRTSRKRPVHEISGNVVARQRPTFPDETRRPSPEEKRGARETVQVIAAKPQQKIRGACETDPRSCRGVPERNVARAKSPAGPRPTTPTRVKRLSGPRGA